MDQQESAPAPELSRAGISAALSGLGWRYVLGAARSSVAAGSIAQAAGLAARAAAAAGADADACLRLDVRPDQVLIAVCPPPGGQLTAREIEVARRISAMAGAAGLVTDGSAAAGRPAQAMEIAVDALDIPAVRPFWKAVMGYADEAGPPDPGAGLADPAGQGPAFWFQQMDEPRPQRNRIHFDIWVPHDEAPRRVEAAIAAGGALVSDDEAPAFWLLADAEGNEACVCTWQGRGS